MITAKQVSIFLKYNDIDFLARQPKVEGPQLSEIEWQQIDSILQDLQLAKYQFDSEAFEASSVAKHKALATEDALALLHQHVALSSP